MVHFIAYVGVVFTLLMNSLAAHSLLLNRNEALKEFVSIYPFVKRNHVVIAQINELLLQASYCNDEAIQQELQRLGLSLLFDTSIPSHVHNDELYNFFLTKGFRGQIFVDDVGNFYPVIRGTAFATLTTIRNNIITDVSIITQGEFNDSYRECINQFAFIILTKVSPHAQITLHGHSLGGAAAHYLGFILALILPHTTIIVCASDPIGVPSAIDRALTGYNYLKQQNKQVTFENLIDAIDTVPYYKDDSNIVAFNKRNYFIEHELHNALFLNFVFALHYDAQLYLSPVATLHEQLGEVFLLITSLPPRATECFYSLLAWEIHNPDKDIFSLTTLARILKWGADILSETKIGKLCILSVNFFVEQVMPTALHGLTINHGIKVLSTFDQVINLTNPLTIVVPFFNQLKTFKTNIFSFKELLEASKPFLTPSSQLKNPSSQCKNSPFRKLESITSLQKIISR